MNKRHSYQTNRYTPGVWNGLGGWTHCAQYFNMESSERVAAMMDIAELLRKNGIEFVATISQPRSDMYSDISATVPHTQAPLSQKQMRLLRLTL